MRPLIMTISIMISLLTAGCGSAIDKSEIERLEAANDALKVQLTVQAVIVETQKAIVTDAPSAEIPIEPTANSQTLPIETVATATPYIPPIIIAPELIASGTGLTQFTTTKFLDGFNIRLINNSSDSVTLNIDDLFGAGIGFGNCLGCEVWERTLSQLTIGDHLAKFYGIGSFEIWSFGTAPFTIRYKMNTGNSYLYNFLVPDERDYKISVELTSGRIENLQLNCNNTAYFKQDVTQSFSGSANLKPPLCAVYLQQIYDNTELTIKVDYAQ